MENIQTTGIINGNSDVILDKYIEMGIKFDLILTDPPYNICKYRPGRAHCTAF